jgi:hypothetical protein
MNETLRRFARQTTRGYAISLSEPLPSTLAALLSDRVQQHRKVATKLLALQTEDVEARRALEAARLSDERAKVKAASEGKPLPRAQKTASAEKKVEAVEDEVRAFEQAVANSAENLLAAALPHLREALARVAEEKEHERQRTDELRSALDRSLERQQTLAAEERWIEYVASSNGSVEPYREVALDRDVGVVRAGLRGLFDELTYKREQRAAENDRLRRWEAEQREEFARREAEARRQADAQRVVFEGMKLVEKGGRPVGPAGDFQDEEDAS